MAQEGGGEAYRRGVTPVDLASSVNMGRARAQFGPLPTEFTVLPSGLSAKVICSVRHTFVTPGFVM